MQMILNVYKTKKIALIIFLILISCKDSTIANDQINNNSVKKTTLVKEILKKQLESGASEEYGSFDDYNVEDLNALASLESEILKNNAYTFLSDKGFSEKIDLFFKRKIDPNSNSEFLKIDVSNRCEKKIDFKPQTADFQYIYVSKKNKFITPFLAIPQLINYEKKYPELSVYESKAIFVTDEVEGNKIEIKRWKNIPDIEKQRQKNIQILINRNKYIFNDNKASLVWLKFNDKEFLESLVKIFGYVQDKDLLKWVVENNRFKTKSGITNGEEYGQLIWHRTCDGKFVFHKETIEIMQKEMKPSNGNYMDDLLDYIRYLEEEKTLKFEEKMIIVANVLNLSSILAQDNSYERYRYSMGSYYKFSDVETKVSIDNEFKKNNYYGLTNLKTFWEEAKVDGDGISYPGQE
ncbi:hypothetical protein [Flavobacterium sp. CF136]|uniref:hypothetical protein n=1 Tax=Flavobacterium sp. (strain CF136) TaxID=1144313 RepID=UPI0002715B47|nr:hypothetical protein [Flavobacterium sp. CF136]EJL62013.1 hypothetical protein PMI10_03105 [Flavobacterium sp. CF136]